MHDAVHSRVISTNTLKYVFSLQNNQNRQQKLVNMVNGNDLIKHNYWPYQYLMFSQPRCVFA